MKAHTDADKCDDGDVDDDNDINNENYVSLFILYLAISLSITVQMIVHVFFGSRARFCVYVYRHV